MPKKSLFAELWQVLGLLGKGKWPYIASLSTCAVIDPLYQVAFALVSGRLLNAIEFGDTNLLYSSLILMGAVLLFHFTFQPLTAYHYEGRLYYPIIDFKLRLLRHIARVPLSWLETRHSGDLMTRISQDVDELDDFYRLHTYDLLSSVIWGVGSMVAMFWINPYMAMIMMVLGILTVWGNTAYTERYAKEKELEKEALSRTNQKLTDIIPGLRVIKSFNQENSFAQEYSGVNDQLAAASLDVAKTSALRSVIEFLLSTLGFLGGLIAAAFMVANGILDFGSAMAVILLQTGVTNMFSETGGYYANIKVSLVSVRRILEILDQPQEDGIKNTPIPHPLDSSITFKNVSFNYPGGRIVLDKFNLSLSHGSTTALAGVSGGGKSTIVKLLLGLYRPNQGEILLGHTDISKLSLEDLRKKIAYVSQDTFLFSDTIAENIHLGRPGATDEEVIQAAKKAWAHGFISQLPKGYDTPVGQGGDGLSGGQRQRIAIARAILKDSPILILDEATSALDSESEEELYNAIKELIKGKTVLMVAHRESSVAWADKVHVIEAVESETA